MMRPRTICALVLLMVVSGTLVAQVDMFKRAYLFTPPLDSVGWGEAVAGVDFDGDSKTEIYAVNTNYYDAPAEMIPRIYKYELNADSTWSMVWSAAVPSIPAQNTWPALTSGDWDKDGKNEVIWSPVNFLSTSNPKPNRILVFEEVGDGSDNMGVSDGAGGWRPNAKWVIDTTSQYNLRPFHGFLHDVDFDGALEFIFCDRASSSAGVGYKFGVVSVSTIPDNGDGSEVWTLEASGKGLPTVSTTAYDVVAIDSTIYVFHAAADGRVTRVRFRNNAYVVDTTAKTILGPPGGGWKNVQVVDFNKDGTKEMIAAGYSSTTNNKLHLIQLTSGGDSMTVTQLFDPNTLMGSGCRLLGSAVGDIDNDGNLDVVFGSHTPAVPSSMLRMEYKGAGSITDPASYNFTILDKGFGAGGERFDFFSMFNADADADLEILAGMGYGGDWDVPMLLLDRVSVAAAPTNIGVVRADGNSDTLPDSLNTTATVIGVVTSNNHLGSSSQFYHFIQDATGGILAFKSGVTAPVPSYPIGRKIAVTGNITHYNGLVEIVPANLATDVVDLGPEYQLPAPKVVTAAAFVANAEQYESQLVQIKGVAKAPGSVAWPAAGSSANMTFWDGTTTFTLRISSYTQVDDSAEVTYAVDATGLCLQYDSSTPYNTGYQLAPRLYSDFVQGVATTPNAATITLATPADGSTFTIDDSSQTLTFSWTPAVDLDGDPLVYQWVPIGFTAKLTGNSGADTMIVLKANDLYYNFLGANDTLNLKWRVAAKDPAHAAVYALDTFMVKLVKGAIVGVPGAEVLPTEFALAQNYPNPFNPSTTLRIALPMQSFVTLKIYNMLGQEVVTLVNEERPAGYLNVEWNGRNQLGQQVASGMYLYRMVARPSDGASDFVSSKKMMLLK